MRCARWVLALAACAVLACRAPERTSYGLAPSLLPNIGLAATVAVPLAPASAWHAEARFTDQFRDDKWLADNGFPRAGVWTQFELGLMRATPLADDAFWLLRFGLLGFTARGEPNLVDEPGDYFGFYAGAGRFADLGRGFSFGPELTLLAAHGPDPRALIPQITWGLRWTPSPR